ncbi:MAG: hypothetical protein KDC54_16800, partial [Lewinella sp.]|nr:hypothetical protein [Lewinella sp.]
MQRNFFTFLILLLLPLLGQAQLTTGMIHYEQTIKLQIEVPEDAQQYAHLFPDSQVDRFVLRFTPEATLYTIDESPEAPPPIEMEDGNATIKIKI